MEFRVRKLKTDGTGKPEEFIIYVSQNNQTFVTEIRAQNSKRSLEIVHATIYKGGFGGEAGNRVKILFQFQPEWLLEFESKFKVFQFMQLHQLFRTRAAVKISDFSE